MAPNPAFSGPVDPEDTTDLSSSAIIAANAAALVSTLSALVPLPFPKTIIPSRLISGGVMLQWVTSDGSEHEIVAHLSGRPVARMSFDMGEPFDVAVDSDGPSELVFPPARLGDLRRFKTFEPMTADDEDRLFYGVEWVARSAAEDGSPSGEGEAAHPPCDIESTNAIGTCCRRAGQSHQDHGDWPVNAPVDPAPPFGQPKAVPRIIAGRDQLFVTTLPYARSDIKAAVPIWLWPLLKPFIEALLAAFFKSLFSAKAEFAARGVGIAIEGE